MDTHHIDEFKKTLSQERDRLTAELSSIAKPDPNMKGNWIADYPQMETGETGSHSSQDSEQDEVEEYEVRLEAEHSLESRLLSVIKALHRIDTHTYGKCAKCGNAIPMERLQANPAAEFDIEHQS
ncbi:MAG: TraR/DksA C4-type zinc finger protein [bacterium]|nr:TraR/DksA C4-type zinc finger protein [bacterium]